MSEKCRICNQPITKRLYGGMYYDVCSDACFTKAFWDKYLSNASEYIKIDGKLYDVGSDEGYGGQRFKIIDNKGMVFSTTNLRLIGDLPDSLVPEFTWIGRII